MSARVWILIAGLCALVISACNAAPTAPPVPTIEVPTVVVPSTTSAEGLPLPTLLPTVEIPTQVAVATALSPSPALPEPVTGTVSVTATVETTATVSVGVTQVTSAPATRAATRAPSATAPPAETATPFPEGVPKVYVTSLRVEPAQPKADTPPTFFASFQNASGTEQSYNWCVEIYDTEDEKKNSTGITSCTTTPMPVGGSNGSVTGWAPRGQGECKAYRGRAVARDENDNRAPFIKPDGSILWLDFTVCP